MGCGQGFNLRVIDQGTHGLLEDLQTFVVVVRPGMRSELPRQALDLGHELPEADDVPHATLPRPARPAIASAKRHSSG